MTDEHRDYINDIVRLATDSSNHAIIEVIRGIQLDHQRHTQAEIESREKYRKELTEQLTNTIKETVNGKIDRLDAKVDRTNEKIDKHVTDLNKKFDDHAEKIAPILKEREVKKTLVTEVRSWGDNIGWVSKLIGAVVIIAGAFIWIVKTVLK